MVIKASTAAEVRTLVDALGSGDEVRREAAIGRLAVIGRRAVDRLLAAYNASPRRDTRIAILRTLEAIGDRRGLAPARAAVREGGDLAVQAVGLLRAFLDSTDAATMAGALDALASVALDGTAERRVRLAALQNLRGFSEAGRAKIDDLLDVAGKALIGEEGAPSDHAALWADALEGRLPDDPALLRTAVAAGALTAPISNLQRLIEAVRTRERELPPGEPHQPWLAIRGYLHQTLALRGSRIALYDLRESLERAEGRLPASFLSAAHAVGDVSCLEPLARAWERAADDPAWQSQLAGAFRAIARRERVTRRHAAMQRVMRRYPEAARALGRQ